MKISVYEEGPVKDKEQEFLLKLEKADDCIYLKLVDEKGGFCRSGFYFKNQSRYDTYKMLKHRYIFGSSPK